MSRGSSRTRGRMVGMRRWDGRSRITTDWFGYQNDTELNFSDGDVLVFLHERGYSRRRASFRLHAEYLATTGFESLVGQSVTAPIPTHWAMPARPSGQLSATVKELYLPPPTDVDKDATSRHNLATRNFFAWLYDRPLTGKTLGASLVDVMNRAHMYRPDDMESNKRDMLAYLDRRGYMDFRECVDHALAALQLAESYQMESLWVNAFSHCVGMYQGLGASIEFDAISRATKATITRTRLEMDIRLDRMAKSMTTFFDNDLSGSYLELSQTAKDHMDRFRSFLHAHYIESHGFWPPSGFASSFALRKSLYRSMYMEFRALYQYLVDPNATPTPRNTKPAEGGLRTLQTVRGFDTRYRLETLPHPLPLLPKLPEHSAPLGFTMKKRRMEREARHAALARSLSDASNRDPDLIKSRLVRSYNQFEKQTIFEAFDPINPIEGRKVRWILIYAILQILASVISAPKEVTNTDGLSYPLCCQTPKTMPWATTTKYSATTVFSNGRSVKIKDDVGKGPSDLKQELRPDVDHLTQRNISSTSLTASSSADAWSTFSAQSSPSTTTTPRSSRAPSLLRFLRKSKKSSTDTVAESTSALPDRPKSVSFHENLVDNYGNSLGETIRDTPKTTTHPLNLSHSGQRSLARTIINNSTFIRTATSPPAYNSPPSSRLRSYPFYVAPQNFTPLLASTSLLTPSRPESPAPPTVSTTPSSSRASSRNSATSRITSNTSNCSDGEPIEHHRNESIDAATGSPTLIPTPKPLHTTTNRSSSISSAQRPSSPEHLSIPILSTVVGPDKHLSLPSVTGFGRMGKPTVLSRCYSGSSSSSTSVDVIREETEVS